jgi:rRNA-processing protein EBP2
MQCKELLELYFRRKQREQKQYSKQVQAERIKEKAQDKKRQIDSISKLRKSREKSVIFENTNYSITGYFVHMPTSASLTGHAQGFAGELDYNAEIQKLDKGRQMGGSKVHDRNRPGKGSPQVNKKRQAKNAKFGKKLCSCFKPMLLYFRFKAGF